MRSRAPEEELCRSGVGWAEAPPACRPCWDDLPADVLSGPRGPSGYQPALQHLKTLLRRKCQVPLSTDRFLLENRPRR